MLQDEAQSESLPAKTASAEVISTNSGGGDSETDAPVLLDKPASVPLKARRVLGGTTSEERLKEIRETFFVSGFHFAKDKIIIRLNKLTRRKEFVFQVPSKNPYEAAAWAKRLGEHLKHYVKHKEKMTGQDE